jgi:hypothetical protein
MLDVDTFLTALYVMVDDFRQSRPQKEQHPGPDASLSPRVKSWSFCNFLQARFLS